MKNTFTLLLLLSAGLFLISSCDNGNADVVLRDSAPIITLEGTPAVVESGAPLQFTANLVDGATPELSKSPLASYSYTMTDTTSKAEVLNFSESISGTSQTIDVSIETEPLPNSVYTVLFTATDVANLTSSQEFEVEIIDCPAPAGSIGIIGDSTPGGWDSDTDLTQDATNPFLWTGTFTLTDGEAKFRQDNDWGTNWGATAFPSGSGTQDGPNIPITAGEYDVTFNSCTGAYTFSATE
jgi:hypothetical protein